MMERCRTSKAPAAATNTKVSSSQPMPRTASDSWGHQLAAWHMDQLEPSGLAYTPILPALGGVVRSSDTEHRREKGTWRNSHFGDWRNTAKSLVFCTVMSINSEGWDLQDSTFSSPDIQIACSARSKGGTFRRDFYQQRCDLKRGRPRHQWRYPVLRS